MEKARKGDLKAVMLKAKMSKPSKMGVAKKPKQLPGLSAEQNPLGGISAEQAPLPGLSAEQKPLGGISAIPSNFSKILAKPKVEMEVDFNPPTEVKHIPVTEYLKKKGKK
jgi:hypothetical protein